MSTGVAFSGRSRQLRAAAWRAVWGCLQTNRVYAARYRHLTTREHHRLTPAQAHTAVAAAILRQLYAVITQQRVWDPVIATHGTTGRNVIAGHDCGITTSGTRESVPERQHEALTTQELGRGEPRCASWAAGRIIALETGPGFGFDRTERPFSSRAHPKARAQFFEGDL